MDWESSDETFFTNLVDCLSDYGRMSSGQEALWMLLDYVKSKSGEDSKKRIDKLWAEMTNSQTLISGARYQDLYALTVQIRHPETNQVVGVGVLIQNRIVTCGDVVRAAGNDQLSFDKSIHIFLPKSVGSRERLRAATVETLVRHHEDEIVVLQLLGDSLPGTVHAQISSASDSRGHKFQTYGYVGAHDLPNDYANGEILGYAGLDLEVDCVLLRPDDGEIIHLGMRGACVLDLNQDKVVGILLRPLRDRRAAAVDAHIVNLEPLKSILNSGKGVL
ncbi:MAG: hypothetical protein HC833_13380 [Leptolyngbyaceae cyanobacterium RM1_406_9]|nr:hypothetical protein [Leptolyngbyaceae cyanobacterium SM1_4_3]NJO74658.1 hypothetical protein [Leptolyngbyaceae cyanobacterium RM1_406_9]